jgi:hypothetical protein
VLTLAILAACSIPCESAPAGSTRDTCLHRRVADDPERWSADEVLRFSGDIEDPIVREATVMTWVRAHRGSVNEADRQRICGIFTGVERNTCDRRLAAAHLSR